MGYRYLHCPNSADGYDHLFTEVSYRDTQHAFDWCVVHFGDPDHLRKEDNERKWTAGSWSFMFAQETDALWFRMWCG